MELEVGMYVRTRYGIAKITNLSKAIGSRGFYLDREFMDCNEENWKSFCTIHDIIGEPSHSIIGLIAVGDYVNGNKIIKISIDHCGKTILIYGYDNGDRQVAITIYEDEIKSIVTKEQFESMAYKVSE